MKKWKRWDIEIKALQKQNAQKKKKQQQRRKQSYLCFKCLVEKEKEKKRESQWWNPLKMVAQLEIKCKTKKGKMKYSCVRFTVRQFIVSKKSFNRKKDEEKLDYCQWRKRWGEPNLNDIALFTYRVHKFASFTLNLWKIDV